MKLHIHYQYLLFSILCLYPFFSFSQTLDSQISSDITTVKTRTGIYLEVSQVEVRASIPIPGPDGKIAYPTSSENDKPIPNKYEYWMTFQGRLTLQNAMQKAISWAKLNRDERFSFTKEIARLRVMNKEDYNFHGFIPQFTKEVKVVFTGLKDGSFKCKLNVSDDVFELKFMDEESIQNFINILKGKSARKEIDSIFH